MVRKIIRIDAVRSSISEALSFVEENLNSFKAPKKNVVKTMLLTEEILVSIIDAAEDTEKITLSAI